MAKQLMEDADNLKRRARRRLIGAVALSTAIVVVLPMLLDSEPQSVGSDIEIRIPDKDKMAEFVPNISIPPVPDTPQAASVEAAPAPAAASQVLIAPVAPAAEVSPPTAVAAASPPAAAPKESFVVQIGAFTNADSAHRLQTKLRTEGIKVYTENIGDKIRVRAGPYPTRAAADQVRLKLEMQGLKPVVSQSQD